MKDDALGLNAVNEDIMPLVSEIEGKLTMLSEDFKIPLTFGFPKITEEDLLKGPGEAPSFDEF